MQMMQVETGETSLYISCTVYSWNVNLNMWVQMLH